MGMQEHSTIHTHFQLLYLGLLIGFWQLTYPTQL